jgi:hypothetical protein
MITSMKKLLLYLFCHVTLFSFEVYNSEFFYKTTLMIQPTDQCFKIYILIYVWCCIYRYVGSELYMQIYILNIFKIFKLIIYFKKLI